MHEMGFACRNGQSNQSSSDDPHLGGAVMVKLLHDAIVWVLLDSSVAFIAHQQVDLRYLRFTKIPISCCWAHCSLDAV